MHKNKVTAALLAIFLGFVGVHKLYLNKIGGFIGFIMLFWVSLKIQFPLSVIIGIIQGVKMLNMSDMEFDKRYNRGFVPVRRGPLEARREEQLRKYEQMPPNPKRNQPPFMQKPTPTMAMKSNPYKVSGIKKYKDFDLDDAILDFKKGLEISPNDVALHFNIACAYSLTEKKALAFHHLAMAVSNGLKDSEKIMSHDDLAYVRIQPEFMAFRQSGFKQNPFAAPVQDTHDETNHTSDNKDVEDTLLKQLNQLSALRKQGVLSEDEFNIERKRILKQ